LKGHHPTGPLSIAVPLPERISSLSSGSVIRPIGRLAPDASGRSRRGEIDRRARRDLQRRR
jgi:hypothetical protein